MFAKIAPVKALGAVAGSLTVAPAWRHIATSLRDKQHKTTHVTLQSVEREVELLRRCGSGQQNGADGQAGEAPHAAVGRTIHPSARVTVYWSALASGLISAGAFIPTGEPDAISKRGPCVPTAIR